MSATVGAVHPPGSRRRFPEEGYSVDELNGCNLASLQDMVERLSSTNPFFAKRFASAGVDASDLKSLEDMRRFPTMSKEDLIADIEAFPPFGSRLGIERHEIRDIVTSGGSSGKPPEVYAYSAQDLQSATEICAQTHYWNGCDAGGLVLTIAPVGLLASPIINVRAWEHLGMAVLRTSQLTTTQRVEAFVRYKPDFIKFPFVYVLRFMDECAQRGVLPARDVPNLNSMNISGCAYDVQAVIKLEEFFGSRIHETYGCSQAGGMVASTCEIGIRDGLERGWLHVLEPRVFVEILDPETDQPVAHGEEGEVVLTSTYRTASPVFRYRMGDRARYGEAGLCRCGRPFVSIECGSIARYDDQLKIKGINVWMHEVDAQVLGEPWVDEFNGFVEYGAQGRERVVVQAEAKSQVDVASHEALMGDLEKRLRANFKIGFEVEIVAAGTVRRFEHKGSRWQDRRRETARRQLDGGT